MHPIRILLPVLLLSFVLPAQSSAKVRDQAASYVERTLHISSYKRADADLNGDGKPETFIYSTVPSNCGSGGCGLLILSPQKEGFRIVLRSTVTQLPIRLLKTSTHGWRDVGVTVAGGGIIQAYTARLRFDGRRYPSNPTVPPAIPMSRASGHVLISE
jgi:hypothetical protein